MGPSLREESKWQSMEWKYSQLPYKKKSSKPNHLQENWCLQCFGTHKAQYSKHWGTTINSVWYSEMLTDRLKPAIRSKHCGLLSKGVVLLHDSARPHTAAHTAETLRKLKFEVMAHPPYSPDLSPSDYHLFGPLKEALRGCWFTSDQEVKEPVHAWLAAQPKTFWRASGSLCNDGSSVLKSKGTVLKNDVDMFPICIAINV